METFVTRIEPLTFARVMQLPAALRSDILECASVTGMPSRQVDKLVEKMRRDMAKGDTTEPASAEIQQ